jgi:hypothetical protein
MDTSVQPSDVRGDEVALEDRRGAAFEPVRDGGEDGRREEVSELLDGVVDLVRRLRPQVRP